MYIPDKEWDLLISDACDTAQYLETHPNLRPIDIGAIICLLNAFINLNDAPVVKKPARYQRIMKKCKDFLFK